jgi:phosphopantothenoylcysteine synthetase/decarboxylase
MTRGLLYVVVCGAGPAAHVDRLIALAMTRSWQVQVVSTPSGMNFINVRDIEALAGTKVRSEYRRPGEQRSSPADAVIVAPATFNTVNKLAAGISDTYALGLLNEAVGADLPVVVLPFVNTALAGRLIFQRSVESLREEGVVVMNDSREGNAPHEPGTGDTCVGSFPWQAALDRIREPDPG